MLDKDEFTESEDSANPQSLQIHALYEQLQNPLTRSRDNRDRERLKQFFPALSSLPDRHYLALRRYFRGCPERFFNRQVHECFLEELIKRDATDRHKLKSHLDGGHSEINCAFLFLREINSEHWHDELPGKGDEYDLIRFIDKQVHPTYLRLVEAVLAPLSKIVAHFSRIDRGAGTDGLDVWATVQELSRSPMAVLVAPYLHVMRNGIAHGGITYLQNEIRYRDKKGSEETLGTSAVIRLCDDLLDTCNALAAALKVFLIIRRQSGYNLPQELLLEELQEETQTPWWRIEGCVSTEIGEQRQLIVYARPNSRDYAKIHFSVLQTGILAEFFAPGYHRYFLSLRSPKAFPGWAAFDGNKLERLRLDRASDFSKFHGVVENDLIFYVPKPALPKFLCKLDTFLHSLRLNWPLAFEQQRQKLAIPLVVARNANIHRNRWGSVLNGAVFVEGLGDPFGPEVVRRWRKRIVKIALQAARKNVGFFSIARYLPVGFARISVFRRDYRQRRLGGFGLGENLVCTVQLQRNRRIRSPDIWGSTVEVIGRWRIAWNKAWLEATGQQSSAQEK